MSFNFNGPNFRPMIQEAQSMQNNGGGGNTGYFQRGKKKKEDEEIDVFNSKDSEDVFVSSEEEAKEKNQKDESLLNKIVKKVKETVVPQPEEHKPHFGDLSKGEDGLHI